MGLVMSFAYAPVAGRGTQRGHPGRGCSGTCQEGRRRACLGRDLGEPVAAAVHVLLEAADLADAAIANLRPLVVVLDLHVQRLRSSRAHTESAPGSTHHQFTPTPSFHAHSLFGVVLNLTYCFQKIVMPEKRHTNT